MKSKSKPPLIIPKASDAFVEKIKEILDNCGNQTWGIIDQEPEFIYTKRKKKDLSKRLKQLSEQRRMKEEGWISALEYLTKQSPLPSGFKFK